MGAIAKAAQAAPAQGRTFKDILAASWPRMAAVMPKHMSEQRMYQLALSCYNQVPHLAECSPASVLGCVMKCSALGLEPSAVDGLGRAYILPYRNGRTGGYEAQFILGYKGMLDLCRRSGELLEVSARAVYEGDEFYYEFGLDEQLHHVPSLEPKEGRQLAYVYCVAKFRDGGHYIDVMSRAEVDAVRRRSKASNNGPWVTDYEAMAKKTVLRRAFPYLPVSIEAQGGAAADETTPRVYDEAGELLDIPGNLAEPEPEPAEVPAEASEAVSDGQEA